MVKRAKHFSGNITAPGTALTKVKEPIRLSTDDKEVKKAAAFTTAVKEQPATLPQRLEYFSQTGSVVQREAFLDEIKDLKSQQKAVKKLSPLYRLDPFLDEQGILRVGGRIRQASISDEVKHPVILPKEGHIPRLVIKDLHEAMKHQGRGFTLNEVRSSGYWIVGCSGIVSRLIQNCTTCKKLRASVQEQKMADLPEDRAVHLEVANTLETDSYINALRRFICRRGPVRLLRSDQGTNLVGAKRELRDALSEMDRDRVKAEMLKSNCDWIEFKFKTSHLPATWAGSGSDKSELSGVFSRPYFRRMALNSTTKPSGPSCAKLKR
ncbi:hypothetical protein QZH41_005869 [Actinostola sp. cb2023]|nr:hypothetical protein QZH41_005869 [Actinostola sp. cb2023]